jgi:hypothetical protein
MREFENSPNTLTVAMQKVFPQTFFARQVSMIVPNWPASADLRGAPKSSAMVLPTCRRRGATAVLEHNRPRPPACSEIRRVRRRNRGVRAEKGRILGAGRFRAVVADETAIGNLSRPGRGEDAPSHRPVPVQHRSSTTTVPSALRSALVTGPGPEGGARKTSYPVPTGRSDRDISVARRRPARPGPITPGWLCKLHYVQACERKFD